MRSPQTDSSLAGEAYSVIRNRIVRGEVAIGEVISRRKVAAELGMSFLPVSEAFLRLEFEGLLESRPRAGTRVRIPTREDVRGQYIVREGLEVQAAKLFAQHATAAERAEMLELAARVDEVSCRPDPDRAAFVVLHEMLHTKIGEYARCPLLSDAIEKTNAISNIWICIGRLAKNRRHQRLIEALVKGDPAEAAEAMRVHITTSMEAILEDLEPYFRMGEEQGQTYARGKKNKTPIPQPTVIGHA